MGGSKSLPLILALCWPLTGAAAADASRCSRSTIKTNSLTDGRVLVPVTVDGHRFSFLLDTGGISSTIKMERVKELGLPVKQTAQKIAGTGGSLLNFYSEGTSISVGEQPIKNRQLYIETRNLAAADGTLAADILRDYDVDIDLAGQEINLISPGYCSEPGTVGIPMDVARNGHVRLAVKVDGNTIAATLDTGARVSVISMRAAAQLGVYANSPGLVAIASNGQYQIYSYPFQILTLGSMSVKNPHIAIASDGFIPGADSGLILGMDALQGLHFTLAYSQNRLFVSGTTRPDINNHLASPP
jgi:predicted aspartyl protease